MEIIKSTGSYSVKGGKTILGKIFAYQEKTGMSIKEILKIPYIMFVLGMLDAPAIDYESKEDKKDKKDKKDKVTKPTDAQSQINAIAGILG